MKSALAILFSVCVLVGIGQVLQSPAIEVSPSIYDTGVAVIPTTEIPAVPDSVAEIPMPPEIPTVPVTDASFGRGNSCPDGGNCNLPANNDTNENAGTDSQRRERGIVAGVGCCAGKAVKALLGRERRAARRASRG